MYKFFQAFKLENIFSFLRKNKKSVFIVCYIMLLMNMGFVFYKDHLSRQDDKLKNISNIERVMKTIKALPDPSQHWNKYQELNGMLNELKSDSLTLDRLEHIKQKTDELYKGN
ncbi:MAG: hypothetical protein ACPGSD_12075 [Flavobacteriales bacterium]|jgi:predicted negative regulator of RcsB-dependent stress response